VVVPPLVHYPLLGSFLNTNFNDACSEGGFFVSKIKVHSDASMTLTNEMVMH